MFVFIGIPLTVSDHNLHRAASLVGSSGNLLEAKKIYEYLLSLYPESLDGLFQMGRILLAEEKYDQAIGYFQAFLNIRPHETIVKQILEKTKKMLEEQSN
ncbi:MAG: tetratricopeptide repeat protein [Alphaproteobacteria bacterium]|nr:tetratricopeptide repeat protein [Alphaproteobacteria bacterium]